MAHDESVDFLRGGDDEISVEIDLDPDLDDRYRLLSDHRRRALLYLLSESDARVNSVPSLAVRIARLEAVGNLEAADVAVELKHNHLPQLDDAGVIDYDDRSGMVVYEGDERVETLLELAREREASYE